MTDGLRPCLRFVATDGLETAAEDIARNGICLVLADAIADLRTLAPALPEEIAEAARYPDGMRGAGHILRRRITRSIIALTGGLPAERLRITRKPTGAPVLEDEEIGMHLSFSARGELGLIGIARCPLGVDIEMPVAAEAIPWNLLRPDERAVLHAAGAEAANAFQRLWAAKEAIAKLFGLGFSLEPETISLSGWKDGNILRVTGIANIPSKAWQKIRLDQFRLDLKPAGNSLRELSTGGLVVVAARGAQV